MKKIHLCVKLIVLFIILLSFSLFFYDKILASYAQFFFVEKKSKGADALVVLAGDDRTRVKKAIELKREGFAGKILITSAKEYTLNYPLFYGTRDALLKEIFKREQEDFIYISSSKGGATSTFDEAYDVGRFCKERGFKRVILVTDGFHTRRALFAFEKIFSKMDVETKLEISGAGNNHYDYNDWYKSEPGLSALITEGFKYILYRFVNNNLKTIKEQ